MMPTRKNLERNAAALRQNMTTAERRLVWGLKNAFPDMDVKCQKVIGPYIVDIVLPAHRVVIEADGGQHLENKKDRWRDILLRLRGYRVLRFWNNEIMENLDGCLESTYRFIAKQ